ESGEVRIGGLNEDAQNALNQDQVINDELAGNVNGEADLTDVSAKPLEEQDESGKGLVSDNLDEDSGFPLLQREGTDDQNVDVASAGFVLSPRRDKFSIEAALFDAEEEPDVKKPQARNDEIKRTLAKLNSMGVSVPKSMSGRCDKIGRRTRLAQGGGGIGVENAVVRGLKWLKASQNADGSWGKQHIGAMTGLALLCFLGHCELTDSAEYGDAVARGAKWLVEHGDKQNGWLYHNNDHHGAAYAHGIATYGLAEAFSMTEKEWMLPVLTKALAHIVNGQKNDGGWFYLENVRKANGKTELDYKRNDAEGSDTSVSGWQFQALKAAYNSGAEFPGVKQSLTDSVKNFYRVYSAKNGGFGYRKRSDGGGKHKLTGVGALGIQGWKFGHEGQDRNLVINKACQHILQHSKFRYDSSEANLYSWYYETQALFNKGGIYWEKWNQQMQPELIRAQDEDGSWKKEGSGTTDKRAHSDGKVYRTTLCILMLEVYYRYVY
ncbi:MAG: prenyltransferase/squalene oxidase repeat-containing protein, partial [Opitutales bacterium]